MQKKIEVIPVKNITKTTLKKDAVGNIIRDTSNIKDEIGNPKTKWEDVQLLQGVIQQQQDLEINTAGSQSKLQYVGYFVPNFNSKLASSSISFIGGENTTLNLSSTFIL